MTRSLESRGHKIIESQLSYRDMSGSGEILQAIEGPERPGKSLTLDGLTADLRLPVDGIYSALAARRIIGSSLIHDGLIHFGLIHSAESGEIELQCLTPTMKKPSKK